LIVLGRNERLGPILELHFADMVVQLNSKQLVAFDCLVMHLVLGDEVHLVKLVTGLVNAMDQRLDPDSHACKVRLLVGHRRPLALVRVQVEQFLDFLDL